MKNALRIAALFLAAALPLRAQNDGLVLARDVPIPMRDGVTLRANVMRPQGAGPFPVLVYRTPYDKEEALQNYTTFRHALERGYAVVVEDVRGRYASAGEFRPYENEGRDGYDTIEWAARQPWSNGAVGTFGLSYPGAVQWLAAMENPPHLKAMVPAMTFSTYRNFFYAGGTFDMSWIDWLWFNIAPDIRQKKNLPGPRTGKEAAAAWKTAGPEMQAKLPLSAMDAFRTSAPYYYDWMKHPVDDPWWDWCELRDKYGRTQAAVLNLSGWYDDNYGPEGATTNFRGLVQARGGQPDRTALLIGPWVHGVEETGIAKAGKRSFAPDAAINYDETILRWMDHYLRGIANGVEKQAPVRYYAMGEEKWHEAATWPPQAQSTTYYLAPATTGKKVGALTPTPKPARAFSTFVSDPAHPVKNPYDSSGAHDYRALAERADLLTFDTAPLSHDLEIAGNLEADIFLHCDCRDLDLWARVYDVAPDGAAFNLMSPGTDVQRVSYREIKKGRQLLQPGKIYAVRLPNLITSNQFKAGHRIRLQISGSFFPNFSRNLQTGENETISARTRKATIRIYHDRQHASCIVLPVITGGAEASP
jgi:hypothetical protein